MSALHGRILEGREGQQYRVEEPVDLDELGSPKGAMARVFRVYDLENERYLAAKIINPRLLDDEAELRARFMGQFYKEARIMEELQHPAIARLYDYNTEGELPFLIMDHIEGETLDDLLRREGRLTFPEAMRILEPVTEALAYAHSRSVVHRDIKPSNILLDKKGNAFLTDFGIARAAQESGLSTRTALTLGSYQFGTPMYMAPEQALRLAEAVGPHTDQYSLAVVTWRMLAGRYYLARTDSPEAKDYSSLVVGSKPLPLARYAPTVPPRAEQAIARALSKSPYERFPGVLDFLNELKYALANPDSTPIVDPLGGWEEPAWLLSPPVMAEAPPKPSVVQPEITSPTPMLPRFGQVLENITAPLPKAEPHHSQPILEPEISEALAATLSQPLIAPKLTGPIAEDETPREPLDLKLPDWLENGPASASLTQEQVLPEASLSESWFNPETAVSPPPPVVIKNSPPPPKSRDSQSLPKLKPEYIDPWVLKAGSYPGAKAEPGRYRLNWITAAKQEKWAYKAIVKNLRGKPPVYLWLIGPVAALLSAAALYLLVGLPLFVALPAALLIAVLLTLPFYLRWRNKARALKGQQPTILTGWLVRIGEPYEKTASGKIVLKESRTQHGPVNPSVLTIATSPKFANEVDQTYTVEIWGEDKIELPSNSLNQRIAIATINNQASIPTIAAIKVLTHI